jgi:AmmeMemoRadiSam system protein A
MTSHSDRLDLLHIAREALAAHLAGGSFDVVPSGELARSAGAFVTVTEAGALRGCIGHLEPTLPLAEVVARCAVAAGTSDPRFAALTAEELPHVEIELTILGPLEIVAMVDDIEIGRHGLVVAAGGRKGVLLPKVAVEQGWDRDTFVAQTCRKAGLLPDAWKQGTIWRFEAEVFTERRRASAASPGS